MLIVTAVIVATVVVCSFVTVAWWQRMGGLSGIATQPMNYSPQPSASQSFTVIARVDLSDGMSYSEAISVAQSVFTHKMQNAAYTVNSAASNYEGIWTVNLSWGTIMYGQPGALSHVFSVQIEPFNQTATYSNCN